MGSNAIDVAIGLLFIFLLYSLLATTIQEMFATAFALRARLLRNTIVRMLADSPPYYTSKNWFSRLYHSVKMKAKICLLFFFPYLGKIIVIKPTLASLFYSEPTIKYLGLSYWYRKPSYINPRSFSRALLNILDENGTANEKVARIDEALLKENVTYNDITVSFDPETRKYIASLWDESGRNIDKFRELLEEWFGETMELLTGWYKRRTQFNIFVIGFIIAFAFNVDTISISNRLSRDKKTREMIVNMANTYVQNSKNVLTSKDSVQRDYSMQMDSIVKSANMLIKRELRGGGSPLALGWNYNEKSYKAKVGSIIKQGTKPKKLLGFLVTAVALSLGAPFWFDLLGKLVKAKGSGKSKEEN